MDLAGISLVALLVVILASGTTTVNPGILAIVLAWVIGDCSGQGRPCTMLGPAGDRG